MSHFLFLTLYFLCLSCFIALSHALNNGFSVELIHRDSTKSPLYRPTKTEFQKVLNIVRRSINRANHFNKISPITKTPVSNLTLSDMDGEYLMSYSIGTPPFKVYDIIDTGSNLVWLQCKPCDICYNQTTAMFNPSKSSSYKNISCSSKTCKSLKDTSCSYNEDVCEYIYGYGDGSKSQGDLSVETLTMDSTSGSSVSFPKIVIGCGHNSYNFPNNISQSSGIIGLESGPMSLTTQLGSSIDGKFSYCLIPLFGEYSNQSNLSSKLNFGGAAIVSGDNVVSTPIVKVTGEEKYSYLLTLEAFSVGNKKIEFRGFKHEGSNASTQNIIIDCGTTVTILPQHFHTRLESVVAKMIKFERFEDSTNSFSLCYNTTSKKFPIITAHFSGADIKLDSSSTFIPIFKGIKCFAFRPSPHGLALFGNLAQSNLLVGYDLKKNLLSFKPTDCTKH